MKLRIKDQFYEEIVNRRPIKSNCGLKMNWMILQIKDYK